jgi:heme exporter protein A
MNPPNALLAAQNLTLVRGGRQVFEDVSLNLAAGEVLLVRGPNGAGKSSLLLTLAGILHPSAGTIRYGDGRNGEDLAPNLHFVAHQTGVKTRLTLAENLRFWAALFGSTPTRSIVMAGLDPATQQSSQRGEASLDPRVRPGDDGPVGVAEALHVVGLAGMGDLDAGYLSAGQTRRLALARLLVARRTVWLLDEPTAALDADGDGLVARLISDHAGRGGIAIAATHHDLDITTQGKVQTLALGAT